MRYSKIDFWWHVVSNLLLVFKFCIVWPICGLRWPHLYHFYSYFFTGSFRIVAMHGLELEFKPWVYLADGCLRMTLCIWMMPKAVTKLYYSGFWTTKRPFTHSTAFTPHYSSSKSKLKNLALQEVWHWYITVCVSFHNIFRETYCMPFNIFSSLDSSAGLE